jgi:MarR family transcriptional regulator, organic hydroperoxide resistance regulator
MAGKLQSELKQSKPFSSLEEEVLLNMVRTADMLSRKGQEVMKERGLSEGQYNVLRILRGAGKAGLRCQEIGERMVTRDPDITRLLDRLEKRGLLKRERSTKDRRVVNTCITATGLKLLEDLQEPLVKAQSGQLAHMKSKLKLLNELLEEARETAK